jgi:hypothetical protein
MWPDWVIAFVGDGRIALLALAVIGLEALVIVVFMRSRARVGSLILTMASGAGLLGALYAALSEPLPGQSLSGWSFPCWPMPPIWGCASFAMADRHRMSAWQVPLRAFPGSACCPATVIA